VVRLFTRSTGVALLCVFAGAGAAQEPKKAKTAVDLPKSAIGVTLETEDGIYLVATYFKPGAGGKRTGAVVLPNVRTHTQRDWYPFAERLVKDGLAVVTFDFRGHGQSTVRGPNARAGGRREGGQVRADEALKSPAEFAYDLDTIKQFLLIENNAGSLNIRQYAIVAVGDLASVVTMNWIANREFGGRTTWTREGGDICALSLVAPAHSYGKLRFSGKLGEGSDNLPIYMLSAGRNPDIEKLGKNLRIPYVIEEGSKERAPYAFEERRAREGGWERVDLKKSGKAARTADLGVEFVKSAEMESIRDKVRGFLVSRCAFTTAAPWEGDRATDQAFSVITRTDQK